MIEGLQFILWSVCVIFCRVRRMMFLLFFRMRKGEREGSFCSLFRFWAIKGTKKTDSRLIDESKDYSYYILWNDAFYFTI